MRPRHRRLILILVALGLAGGAAFLVLGALENSVTFFYSPTELAATAPPPDLRIRVGGLVIAGSVIKAVDGKTRFHITDNNAALEVEFAGIVPDLFREGQGVVAEGRLGTDGVFQADELLAKHDETYMPPEVAKTLKEEGHWKDETAKGMP